MSDPDLLAIASKYKRTPAQVRPTMRLQRRMRVGRLLVGGLGFRYVLCEDMCR